MEGFLEQNDLLYYANPDFIFREIAGENVLIPTGKASEKLFGIVSLNSAGSFLWDALQKKRTLRDLIKIMNDAYTAEHRQSSEDIKEFLKIGLSHNIILCVPKTQS